MNQKLGCFNDGAQFFFLFFDKKKSVTAELLLNDTSTQERKGREKSEKMQGKSKGAKLVRQESFKEETRARTEEEGEKKEKALIYED